MSTPAGSQSRPYRFCDYPEQDRACSKAKHEIHGVAITHNRPRCNRFKTKKAPPGEDLLGKAGEGDGRCSSRRPPTGAPVGATGSIKERVGSAA